MRWLHLISIETVDYMTFNECVESWIEQYDELFVNLKKLAQSYSDYRDIFDILSKQYVSTEIYGSGKRMRIQLLKNGRIMTTSISVDKNKNIELSDTVECWFTNTKSKRCHLSNLRNTRYRVDVAVGFEKYFREEPFAYTIHVYGLKEDSSQCMVYYRHSKEEALLFAKEEQKRLHSCQQCHLIDIYKCDLTDFPDNISVIPNSRYTISTKTKRETKFEMRKNLRFDVFVDEYFYDRQTGYEDDNTVDKNLITIVILSIVKLDSEGNLETDMQLYSTKDEAREKSNEIIEDWMRKNGFTFDEDKLNDKYSHLKLCEKRDFGNSIKINCVQNIAELNISILEIEV